MIPLNNYISPWFELAFLFHLSISKSKEANLLSYSNLPAYSFSKSPDILANLFLHSSNSLSLAYNVYSRRSKSNFWLSNNWDYN